MLKTLTEYNKYIMAGISMLLMVVFLAPTAVSRCSHMNAHPSTVWATTADGSKLTLGDLDRIRGQLQALAALRTICMAEQVRSVVTTNAGLMWLVMAEPRDPEQWWMLAREARAAGLVGGQGDGRMLAAELAGPLQIAPEQLIGRLAGEGHQPMSVVLEALAEVAGVGRMLDLVAGAPRASEARLRVAARELMSTVNCEVVPLNAQLVGDAVPVPQPTQAQLEEQFKLAREFQPGAGPMGAGYRIPEKVALEWIAIPAAEIARGTIEDPALGPVELRKEFLRNASAYTAPATLEGVQAAPTFEQVEDKVRENVRRRLNKERTERIAQFIKEWARGTVKEFPSSGGIVQLPANWDETKPPLTQLSQELVNRFKLPLPRGGDSGPGPIAIPDVDGVLFIGRSSTNEFGQAFTVGQLVAQVRELAPDSRLPLQVGTVGPVLTMPMGDLVVYRVLKAIPSHPPETLAEVEAAVRRDATAKLRYAALVERAPQILAQAEREGLAAVANTYGSSVDTAPQVSLANTLSLLRGQGIQPTPLSQAGANADVVRAVVQRAVSLPTDKPISTLPDSERMLTVPVPDKEMLLVVRINDVTPLTDESWRLLNGAGAFRRALSQGEPSPSLVDFFGVEQLKARQGFALKNPAGPDRPMTAPPPQF